MPPSPSRPHRSRKRRPGTSPALSETKSILAGASFFLGNDSGPAHMAAAFGVPLLALFGLWCLIELAKSGGLPLG